MDSSSYAVYETNVDIQELGLDCELEDAYTLVCNCFNSIVDHDVELKVDNDVMRAQFSAKIGGYFRVEFEVLLREKQMTEGGKMTTMIHRLEAKQKSDADKIMKKIQEMETFMEALSYAHIPILKPNNHFNQNYSGTYPESYPINATQILITIPTDGSVLPAYSESAEKIKLFPKLEKLSLTDYVHSSGLNCDKISSKTVSELVLSSLSAPINMNIIERLPNLKKLSIISCGSQIQNLMESLRGYKHQITHINVQSTTGINQTELMTYCQSKNIQLNMT